MRRGTADTGASFEFINLEGGQLQRYGGERLTDYATTGGGLLSLHWSVGEQGVYSLRGAELPVRPGNVVITRPDDRYDLRKGSSTSLKVVRLQLNLDAAPAARTFLPNSPIAQILARLYSSETTEVEELTAQIEAWIRVQDGQSVRPEAPCARAACLAADIMLADLAAPHQLSPIASSVGLSVNHLIRSFRAAYGATPHAWLKEQRLRQARTLLRNSPVAEVARRVGWQSPATFSLAFARRFGASPSQWVISDKSPP